MTVYGAQLVWKVGEMMDGESDGGEDDEMKETDYYKAGRPSETLSWFEW